MKLHQTVVLSLAMAACSLTLAQATNDWPKDLYPTGPVQGNVCDALKKRTDDLAKFEINHQAQVKAKQDQEAAVTKGIIDQQKKVIKDLTAKCDVKKAEDQKQAAAAQKKAKEATDAAAALEARVKKECPGIADAERQLEGFYQANGKSPASLAKANAWAATKKTYEDRLAAAKAACPVKS